MRRASAPSWLDYLTPSAVTRRVEYSHNQHTNSTNTRAITVLWSILQRMAREPPGPGGPLRYPLPDYMYAMLLLFSVCQHVSSPCCENAIWV